jgi:hypothetical protein
LRGEPFARQAPEFHGSQLFNDRVEAPPVLLILVVCALRTQPLALTLLPNVLGFPLSHGLVAREEMCQSLLTFF